MSHFLSHMAQLHLNFQLIKCSSMDLLKDMKTKIKYDVKTLYEFDCRQTPRSVSYNAYRAQALLAKKTFIYRVYLIVLHL